MHPTRLVLPLALVLATFACSSADDAPDPTSSQALHKADSLQVSCRYEETFWYSSGRSEVSTKCSRVSCYSEMMSGGQQMVIGGELYNDPTTKAKFQPIMGSCDDGVPVTCESYAEQGGCNACLGEHCCEATFLCDHDPNCGAIIDCVNDSGDDADRAKRCVENGDYTARENFKKALSCITGSCKSECQ